MKKKIPATQIWSDDRGGKKDAAARPRASGGAECLFLFFLDVDIFWRHSGEAGYMACCEQNSVAAV